MLLSMTCLNAAASIDNQLGQCRNFASIHMAMRLGFKQEAQMREQAMLMDGSRTDFLGFGLLHRDWKAQKMSTHGIAGAS